MQYGRKVILLDPPFPLGDLSIGSVVDESTQWRLVYSNGLPILLLYRSHTLSRRPSTGSWNLSPKS